MRLRVRIVSMRIEATFAPLDGILFALKFERDDTNASASLCLCVNVEQESFTSHRVDDDECCCCLYDFRILNLPVFSLHFSMVFD